MRRRLYLQLGRAGDVLNVLPLCLRDYSETALRPLFVVAKPFAAVLAGASYVRPVVFDGDFEDVAGAYALAERVAESEEAEIICSQIYGRGFQTAEACASFMRESWSQVPRAPAWGTLPLLFDTRSQASEGAVRDFLFQRRRPGKKLALLALSGTSSPLEGAHELARTLRKELADAFDVVDLSGFIAPRFLDMLGTLEAADVLVTVDSGLLHLAHAVPKLPVVALITREPSPWHGSPWRPQQIARFFYDEAPNCFPSIVRAVRSVAAGPVSLPRIFHVWSDYPIEGETLRRVHFARETWRAEYQTFAGWRPVPFRSADQCRDAREQVGDLRLMPFFHDLVRHVLARAPADDDVIAVTNSDVCATPGITGWILDKVRRHGAAFTHRWDFERLERPLSNEAEVKRGTFYPGSDAFFFNVRWWRTHGRAYPDMIIGREHVDEVLRQLIKARGGVEIPGAIYHERHESFWERPLERATNPGNLHNRRLARKWFVSRGYGPNDHEWWKIPARPY